MQAHMEKAKFNEIQGCRYYLPYQPYGMSLLSSLPPAQIVNWSCTCNISRSHTYCKEICGRNYHFESVHWAEDGVLIMYFTSNKILIFQHNPIWLVSLNFCPCALMSQMYKLYLKD